MLVCMYRCFDKSVMQERTLDENFRALWLGGMQNDCFINLINDAPTPCEATPCNFPNWCSSSGY